MNYYNTVKQFESDSVDDNYIQGWVAGFLNNPAIEEQRITDAYRSGYDNAKNNNIDDVSDYIKL